MLYKNNGSIHIYLICHGSIVGIHGKIKLKTCKHDKQSTRTRTRARSMLAMKIDGRRGQHAINEKKNGSGRKR
jgi:hypothetical protein